MHEIMHHKKGKVNKVNDGAGKKIINEKGTENGDERRKSL